MAGIIKWILTGDELNNVDTISLVEEPAIEINWLAFNKEKSEATEIQDLEEFAVLSMFAEEQKRSYTFEVPKERFQELEGENIIVAPAMVADKLIFRVDEVGNPYYGFFDSESIKNAAHAFQKYKLTDKFNINHESDNIADGVYLAETWLVQDTELDKSRYFGYSLPVGSWMTILKVENQDLYNEYVASGQLQGLSVEAFVLEQILLTNQNLKNGKRHR